MSDNESESRELEEEEKGSADAVTNVMLISDGRGPPHVIAVQRDLIVGDFQEDENGDEDSNLGFDMVEAQDHQSASRKRPRSEPEDEDVLDISCPDADIKELLLSVHKVIQGRLSIMNEKIETLGQRCQNLDTKITAIAELMDENGIALPALNMRLSTSSSSNVSKLGPNMTLITLNSEEDYPCGSWLGDECNPDIRVRTRLTPSDLDDVHRMCHTPEKMALTLLDFLFDRETQACSNISGMGKHGKRQLDPLLVYGIRCHLAQRFNISDKDWQKIKLNLDSKCRTAFRRKQRGMPLAVKAFQERRVTQQAGMPATYVRWSENDRDDAMSPAEDVLAEGIVLDPDPCTDHDESVTLDLAGTSVPVAVDQLGEPQIIHTPEGDIQVVHATLPSSWLNTNTSTQSSS